MELVLWPRGNPVGGGVMLNVHPSFGPAQRATSWLSGTEIHSAPTAALNISDWLDTIGAEHAWLN